MAMRQESTEGVELTEQIVLTRTRAPDLDSVKKLNCWATNISDVAVVRRMPNLEVCSLSINRISTLRDFAHCHKLKELYVRTNKIHCLGDVHYLKNLPKLRSLWLSENPCADADNYRLSVLRTLPHLQKLDNTVVKPEEVQEALSSVEEIPVPQDFSASSLFHPGLSDISVSGISNVSSVDLLGNSESVTSSSASVEHLPIARKKREQRRLRKSEEELARRIAEEDVRSSSEDKQEGVKRGKVKAGSTTEEDAVKTMEGEKHEDEDKDGNSVTKDGEFSNDNEAKNSGKLRIMGGGSDNLSTLSNHISDDSSVSGSCDSNVSDGSKNEGEENCSNEEKRKDINEESTETNIENDTNNNNSCKSGEKMEISEDCTNTNSTKLSIGLTPQIIRDSNHVSGTNDKTEDSMLDRIRLDDSLAVEESQDIQNSIELDDLIVELDEGIPGKGTDKDIDLIKHQPDSENALEKENDSCEDEVETDVSLSPSSPPRIASPKVSVSSPKSVASENYSGDKDRSQDERLAKVESVNWEEYNRMRQDLGMRPMERVSTSRPSSSEVTRARNSNILQAVLSLVKELDKDSLDLVASAVKARRENM